MYRIALRRGMLGLALAAGAAVLTAGSAADAPKGVSTDEPGFKPLFNGKDLTGWKFKVGGDASPEKTFTVKEGVIVVSGHPNGYFYTDKSYKNFILRFDWRYPKEAGNSGCLVYIQPPQKVWPTCIEVQGLYRDHGLIMTVGAAKGKFKFDREAQKKALRPHQEWQTTEVVSQDGMLTSKVNGAQVDSGKSNLTEGQIGFQSEGVEIQFKNIRIKVMD
jgi:hypothetical protein